MRVEGNGAQQSPERSQAAANGSSSPSHTNGVSLTRTNGTANGKANVMGAPSAHVNGSGQARKSTFYGHDREEVARILIQGLSDLGYHSAASALSQESGYELETPYASAFRMAIIQGDWAEAESLLLGTGPAESSESLENAHPGFGGLALSPTADKNEMLFLIKQQKYLELLEERDLGAALMVLRQELQPIHQNERHFHSLTSLIMCQSPEDLKSQAKWDGAGGKSRQLLLSDLSRSISPSAMIPEHRLAELLAEVKEAQILNCPYHNTAEWPSLYVDHQCERDDFPLENSKIIEDHRDEVWYLRFSNDGTKLATASRDKTIVIYDTINQKKIHQLSSHDGGVAFVSWSPDDSKLVSCSSDRTARLWDIKTGTPLRTLTVFSEPVTSACWAPDGQTFVTGSADSKHPLCIWAVDAPPNALPLHNFVHECHRVYDCDLAVTVQSNSPLTTPDLFLPADRSSGEPLLQRDDPTRLVAITTDFCINVFNYASRERLHHLPLEHKLTSMRLSRDGRDMLVNLECDQVWLMDIENGAIRHKLRGQKQGSTFQIRSCFGGAREGFVVSGGEDGKITIWHRHSGRLLERLDAHGPGCANAIAWNMANPGMFASAGDDQKVRIWSKPQRALPPSVAGSQGLSKPSAALPDQQVPEGSLPLWGSGTPVERASSSEAEPASSEQLSQQSQQSAGLPRGYSAIAEAFTRPGIGNR